MDASFCLLSNAGENNFTVAGWSSTETQLTFSHVTDYNNKEAVKAIRDAMPKKGKHRLKYKSKQAVALARVSKEDTKEDTKEVTSTKGVSKLGQHLRQLKGAAAFAGRLNDGMDARVITQYLHGLVIKCADEAVTQVLEKNPDHHVSYDNQLHHSFSIATQQSATGRPSGAHTGESSSLGDTRPSRSPPHTANTVTGSPDLEMRSGDNAQLSPQRTALSSRAQTTDSKRPTAASSRAQSRHTAASSRASSRHSVVSSRAQTTDSIRPTAASSRAHSRHTAASSRASSRHSAASSREQTSDSERPAAASSRAQNRHTAASVAPMEMIGTAPEDNDLHQTSSEA